MRKFLLITSLLVVVGICKDSKNKNVVLDDKKVTYYDKNLKPRIVILLKEILPHKEGTTFFS